MPGIDDFKDLSNAVVDGGNKMKSALSAAVEAAKGLDKILDAVSKQQTKTLQVTKNFRDALKSTAERMEAIKKSTTEANRGIRELKKLFKDTGKEASNFATMAQKDMGILAKQSSAQLKVQKQLFALSKKQTTQSRKFNHEVLDFRDRSRGALKNLKLFNLQLKSGKKLGDAYGKALGDTNIQSTVNIEYDSAGIAKLQAAIVELKKQIEEQPIHFGVDVSKLEEAETLLNELHRLAGKPVEVKMSMAPAPKVMAAAAPAPAKMAPNKIQEYLAEAKAGSWLATPPGAKTVLPPKGKAAAGTESPFKIRKPKPKPVFPRGGIGKKGSFAAAKAGGTEPSKAINTKAVTEYAKRWDAAANEIKAAYSTFSLKVRKGTITDPDQIENTAVKLKGLMQQYESFKGIISSLDPVEAKKLKTTLDTTKSLEEQNAVMTSYIKAHDDLLDRYLGEAEAAQEVARADNDLEKAMNSQFSVLNMVRRSMKKGAEEAREFAGGIKTSGGVLAGAGLAAFFLFKKLGELTEKYKDAAVGLKRFNVELEGQAKALYGSGASAAAFKTIRNQLYLTREQAGEFFDVLTSGVTAGVGSVDKLVSAAMQLRETFGGDQTKRLKEYIDLLKEIPTLDTDLSFTAKADDRAAALFALAEKGQISTVMELRAAGLAGGMQKPLASKEDVKLLNNAQRTEKFLGDMRDAMLNKFFPTWGPQFAAIADNTFKILGAVSAGFAIMGGLKFLAGLKGATSGAGFLSSALGFGGAATAATKVAAPAVSSAPAVASGVTGAAGVVATGATVAGSKATTSTIGMIAKLGKAVKGVAGPLALAGIAFEAAGMGADYAAERYEKSGKENAAANAKMTSSVLKTAGTIATGAAIGATIGSIVPLIGTAVGGLVGALAGATVMVAVNSKEYVSQQRDIRKKLKENSRSTSKIAAAEESVARKIEAAGIAQDAAAIEMGKIFGRLNTEMNTAKKHLYEFNKSLAAVKLENMARLGGSMARFGESLDMLTAAAIDNLRMQMMAAGKSRKDILSNTRLDADTRRDALRKLSMMEAQAVKDFADSIDAATAAVWKSPAILEAGLKSQIAKTKMEFQFEGGGMTAEAGGAALSETIIKASKVLEESQKAGARATEIAAKMTLENGKNLIDRQTKAAEIAGKMPGLRGVAKKDMPELLEKKKKELENFSKQSDDVNETLVGVNIKDLATRMYEISESSKNYATAIKESKDRIAKGGKKEDIGKEQANIDAAEKAMGENAKEQSKLTEQADKYKDQMVKTAGLSEISSGEMDNLSSSWDSFLNSLGSTKDKVSDASVLLAGWAGLQRSVEQSVIANNKALSRQKELNAKKDALVKEIDVLSVLTVDSEASNLRTLEEQKKAADAVLAARKDVAEAIGKIASLTSYELVNTKRQAEIIGIRAGFDTAMGKGIENHVAALDAQSSAYKEQVKVTETAVKETEAAVQFQNEVIRLKEKELKEVAGVAEADNERRKTIQGEIESAKTLKNKAMEAAKTQESAQRTIFDAMMKAVDNFQDTMNRLADMPEFRRVTAEIDLTGAMQEAAQFSDDWRDTMRQSVVMTEKASKDRLELEKAAIEKSYVAKKQQLEATLEEDVKAGKVKPEDAKRARSEIQRTLETNKQLEISKKVTEQKKIEVERAKAAAQYATEMVDMQQQVTDAEAQFLTEVGGNWQSILDLQSQSVQLEKQKAEIAQGFVDDLIRQGKSGRELAQAQTAARLAELKYQQKALGAQKSAYEALAGMAFGAIRSSSGARKNLDSAAMKMGRKATRVKTSAGLYRGADEKGVTTISQRSIMGRLAGLGGGAGPGGVLAGTPKKMTTEKMTEESLKKAEETATQTKNTADATGEMRDLGKTHGSLQTSDDASQNWLSKICDYTGVAADTLGRLLDYQSGSSAGTGERKAGKQIRDAAREGVKETKSLNKEVADSRQTQTGDTAQLSEVQKGVESATRETAGQVREVNSSLIDQLNAAKAELRDANKQLSGLSHDSTSQEIENASTKTTAAMEKVAKIQDQIRVNEVKNPLAGMGNSIDDMAGILHGDISQEMKDAAQSLEEIQKLSASRDATPTKKSEKPRTGDRTKDKFLDEVQKKREKKAKEASAKKSNEDRVKTAKVFKKNSGAEKKKADKKTTDSSAAAKILASGGNVAGMGPNQKVDWKDFRYEVAKAKGEQLNTGDAKEGEKEKIIKSAQARQERAKKASEEKLNRDRVTAAKVPQKDSSSEKKKISETTTESSAAAKIYASGSGVPGMGPNQKVDWKNFRYEVAKAKGEQLNTGDAKGGKKDKVMDVNIDKNLEKLYATNEEQSRAMLTSGSIFTHDISLESAVLGLGKTMETVFSRSAGGVDTAPGQTAAGFAGMGEDTGAGGGGAMKVTGEITVKFDSKMFRTQVAQIVGEVIRTGETRKVLSQQGFANKVNGI